MIRLSYEDIKEQQETAEQLINYWEAAGDHEQTEYYRGCYSALTWLMISGELFADDETNVLNEEE